METTTLHALYSQHDADMRQCSRILGAMEKQSDVHTLRNNILTFWMNDLQKHIEAEEDILVPFLVMHGFNNSYINILHREHDTIRLLAQRLITVDGDGDYLYKTFVHLVRQHTSFENEIVFRKMREMISRKELEQLDREMQRAVA